MSESVPNKVKSPFTRVQRNQLLAWSKDAKDQKLLSAFDRKVLYEGGYYNYIFTSRLSRLKKTLDILSETLEEEPAFLALEIIDTSYQCYLKTGAEKGDPESKFRLGEAYSRAKSLYNKTSKKWQELENIKSPSNIVEFKSQAIDIVDEMMSNDDDG